MTKNKGTTDDDNTERFKDVTSTERVIRIKFELVTCIQQDICTFYYNHALFHL